MSGRSGGRAIACPAYGDWWYELASARPSARVACQVISVGPKAFAIGIQRSCVARIPDPMAAHANGTVRGPNLRGVHHRRATASSVPAKTYGNSKWRPIGVHHDQSARYEVKPIRPATKTQ